ncbi:germ cell nuclear acidic protein isoform X2 [Uranotaenia lowii]|uniref:germ cell nuclear acidic protein isoform X2 n=1 Tax=Uranotaenia lowii TaxID=190385 RepID=UPI002479D162|nr:germ cell nuclear acidic protein isoform X2 [Uranotaenia lowii]
MALGWTGNFILVFTVILSTLTQGNLAAPASIQSDFFTPSLGAANSIDEEVLELEHLKHQVGPTVPLATDTSFKGNTGRGGANTKEEILPQLEKQLEEEAQASAVITSSDEEGRSGESEEGGENDNERDVGDKRSGNANDDNNDDDDGDDDDGDDDDGDANDDNSRDYAEKLEKASESMLLKTLAEFHRKQEAELQKQHHQNHENHYNHYESTTLDDKQQQQQQKDENTQPNGEGKLMKLHPGSTSLTFGQHSMESATKTPQPNALSQPEQMPNDDTEAKDALTNNGQRRSDNAEILLRHSGGQYSAFDMAQYVFWTGDEVGVARAVEELIQKGLMTRENAIKFLRDIRLGIDYLQNTYSSRPMKPNTQSKVSEEKPPHTSTSSTQSQQTTLAPEILKVIERLPRLLKMNEFNEQSESTQDYDDVVGRLRLADFLYAEYSLEEVIYQLAKVMFTQSLTRGSEQSQHALEKLTEFLESEGAHGRISPALQKKILDVLLAALADTLAENPDLMQVARAALGKHFEQLPQRGEHVKH